MLEQLLSIGVSIAPEPTAFLGEVPVSQFITGDALASAVGLTVGTSINSNEPWLKFLDPVDGKTKYIAKKPYKCSITWNDLNNNNLISGNKTTVVNGSTYIVRLLKTSVTAIYNGGIAVLDPVGAYGSEWNRLFYPLIPNPSGMNGAKVSGEGITFGSQASYTEADLVLINTVGQGYQTFCMESSGNNRIVRGPRGVIEVQATISTYRSAVSGWRPCLELVE